MKQNAEKMSKENQDSNINCFKKCLEKNKNGEMEKNKNGENKVNLVILSLNIQQNVQKRTFTTGCSIRISNHKIISSYFGVHSPLCLILQRVER